MTLSLVRGRGWTVEPGVMGTSVCCDVAGFCNPCLALSSALPSDHVHPQNAALIHGLQDSLRMRVPQKISQKHCWALQNHKIIGLEEAYGDCLVQALPTQAWPAGAGWPGQGPAVFRTSPRMEAAVSLWAMFVSHLQ